MPRTMTTAPATTLSDAQNPSGDPPRQFLFCLALLRTIADLAFFPPHPSACDDVYEYDFSTTCMITKERGLWSRLEAGKTR